MQSVPPKTSLRIHIRFSLQSLAMFLVKAWRSTAFGVYGYLNFTKSGFLEHSKNFNPEDMERRIDGKNCIVTGANSGIGYATAHGLASRGATVYMVCRNKERGEDAVSEIQSSTGNQNVHLEVCDLSSVHDIKTFSSRFKEKDIPVHVLVNNAGLLENTRVTTSEGFELNFTVNVLGTYGMTELMLPLLEKSQPDARVITVSSGGMYTVPLTTDLQYESGAFNGVEQYARNKRVQVALTEKWAKKYGDKGIGFYTMHPGWAETPGVAKSLPSFSKSYVLLSVFDIPNLTGFIASRYLHINSTFLCSKLELSSHCTLVVTDPGFPTRVCTTKSVNEPILAQASLSSRSTCLLQRARAQFVYLQKARAQLIPELGS